MRKLISLLVAGLLAAQSLLAVPAFAAAGLVANAGPDQTLRDDDGNGSQAVLLDGSASTHSGGTITLFKWFEGANAAPIATGATAQAALAVGNHTVTLVVQDADGATARDDVLITVLQQGVNPPPVANAGPDQVLRDDDGNGLETVTLDGSGSSDPFGSIVSYQWFGSAAEPEAAGAVVDLSLATGEHTFVLVVTDNEGATSSDSVTVTVVAQGINPAPVADAGPDQFVRDDDGSGAEKVVLDGSGSSDPNGSIASYRWLGGDGVTIAGEGPTLDVTLAAGVHVFTLVVTDNEGATGSDTVRVTVLAQGGNLPPVANAGADQTVSDQDGSGEELVALDGSGSSDPIGTIVSYAWFIGDATESAATAVTAQVSLPIGQHTITLVVTDDNGATGRDQVGVTVEGQQTPPEDPLAGLPHTEGGNALRVLITHVLPKAPAAARKGLANAIEKLAARLGIDVSGLFGDADDDDGEEETDEDDEDDQDDADDEEDDEDDQDDADDEEDDEEDSEQASGKGRPGAKQGSGNAGNQGQGNSGNQGQGNADDDGGDAEDEETEDGDEDDDDDQDSSPQTQGRGGNSGRGAGGGRGS